MFFIGRVAGYVTVNSYFWRFNRFLTGSMNVICSRIFRGVAIIVATLLFTSCASLSKNGVGRIHKYTIEGNIPQSFDGATAVFISDIHYPSKFTRKRLGKMMHKLHTLSPDLLLLGGDYVTSDEYIYELFDSLSNLKTSYGTYAVLGNHETSRAHLVDSVAALYGIRMLNDEAVAVGCDSASIYIAGVRNSFNASPSPSDTVVDKGFTILLAHTPDYAQSVDAVAHLVLSGHTHGGQVSLFGLYTPVKNSRYGTRFLRGRNFTDSGVTVITTTGVGTSRRKIRFCVPSEIVVIELRCR